MHEWNKRKVTYELLKDFSGGEFAKILQEVKALSKTNLDSNSKYKNIVLSMTEDEKHKFDKKIDQLLNYFEGIAISIKNEIVDEAICYDYASIIYKRYYNIFKDYIIECRNIENEQSIYIDFENISLKWIADLEKENRKNIDDRVKPGRPLSNEKEKSRFK